MKPKTKNAKTKKLPLLCGLALVSSAIAAPPPTNVLFIAVDDLRTSLGCYGDPLAKTPNMDRLAKSSRLFSRAYTMQAVCGPSRTAMMTGLLPDRTRVWHNRNLFRDTLPNAVTLPQLFKNNGYYAQALGKVLSGDSQEEEQDPTSWSVPPLLRAPGWSNYLLPENKIKGGKNAATERADVPDEGYPDGKLAKLAIETLEGLKQKPQPFFLAVGFFRPHLPFTAPKRYWDLFDPAVFQPDAKAGRTKNAPDMAYPDHLELGGYRDIPKDERVSAEQARGLRHGYYASVSYVDAQVGKLLDALRRLELEKNTVVVLWGDHGYSLGEADHWCKDTNFDMDTRVPLMIRSPGMPQPGIATQALVEYVDIYPTLAELAGLPTPRDLDGRSIVPILQDPGRIGRDVALSQFSRPFKPSAPQSMGYSIRTETHRYTRWVEWPTRKIIVEELYDYTSARSAVRQGALLVEQENVAQDPAYAETRDRLRTRLDRMISERMPAGASGPPPPSETQVKKKKKQP
jgi:iduronate 2-sulfatase